MSVLRDSVETRRSPETLWGLVFKILLATCLVRISVKRLDLPIPKSRQASLDRTHTGMGSWGSGVGWWCLMWFVITSQKCPFGPPRIRAPIFPYSGALPVYTYCYFLFIASLRNASLTCFRATTLGVFPVPSRLPEHSFNIFLISMGS